MCGVYRDFLIDGRSHDAAEAARCFAGAEVFSLGVLLASGDSDDLSTGIFIRFSGGAGVRCVQCVGPWDDFACVRL